VLVSKTAEQFCKVVTSARWCKAVPCTLKKSAQMCYILYVFRILVCMLLESVVNVLGGGWYLQV